MTMDLCSSVREKTEGGFLGRPEENRRMHLRNEEAEGLGRKEMIKDCLGKEAPGSPELRIDRI